MSDRELLELAAKAAGIGFYGWKDGLLVTFQAQMWNPLTDDGDALRLAVKLEIEIRGFNGRAHAGKQDGFWCSVIWFPDQDPCAATRRAIVRAAAEIGKGMVAQPSGKDLPEDDYYKSMAEAFYGNKP